MRLLAMGCILIILGTALYFTLGGSTRTLILSIMGIVFLVGGVIYPNRAKQKEATTK
ncbi:MAG: hypothetical protein M1368_10520 [Thaumarchaeota archaeon]|nr:hypothetical protein [Nitrososphaerota archaeon]